MKKMKLNEKKKMIMKNYWKKQMKNRNQKLIKYITIEKLKFKLNHVKNV